MLTYNIFEFQNNLFSILDKVAHGECVTITNKGQAITKLVPCKDENDYPQEKKFGFMKENAQVPDNFDIIGAKEIEEMFYGEK